MNPALFSPGNKPSRCTRIQLSFVVIFSIYFSSQGFFQTAGKANFKYSTRSKCDASVTNFGKEPENLERKANLPLLCGLEFIKFSTAVISCSAFLAVTPAFGFDWSYQQSTPVCGVGTSPPCGPESWNCISPFCSGARQSPINIVQAIPDTTLKPLQLAGKPLDTIILKKLAQNWDMQIPEYEQLDLTIRFHGETYFLKDIHFHEPGEHAFGGSVYDAEVHFVHRTPTDKILVVAVVFEAGPSYKDNVVLKEFWGTETKPMFTQDGNQFKFRNGFSPYQELFPADPSYYTYSGSLTTPPCSEDVTWIVMKQPVRISTPQLQAFKKSFLSKGTRASKEGFINRPLQALNTRKVFLYSP